MNSPSCLMLHVGKPVHRGQGEMVKVREKGVATSTAGPEQMALKLQYASQQNED